jgi:hypothetical protein
MPAARGPRAESDVMMPNAERSAAILRAWRGRSHLNARQHPRAAARRDTRPPPRPAIARGRRWLDELIADFAATTESIAKRESCTTRKINMTISLAFLAPDLVKAAIDGQLPHGMGVARLADLSAGWSRQRQMIGLPVL